MSSDSAALAQFNVPGGFPTSTDFVPSVVFLVAYIVSTPVFLWRVARKSSRTIILLRPGLFLIARYIALGLRTYMSKHSFTEDEMIAELVTISLGSLFLLEPLVEMWKRSVAIAVKMDEAPQWVRTVALVLKVGVLAAIITAIVSSSEISNAINNPDKVSLVQDLKKASAILTVAVDVVIVGAALLCHRTFGLAIRNTMFILGCALGLGVVIIYRLIQTFSTNQGSGIHKPIVFWICQMTFEFLVFAAFMAISIPDWFPAEKNDVNSLPMNQQPLNKSQYAYPPPQNAYPMQENGGWGQQNGYNNQYPTNYQQQPQQPYKQQGRY